MLAYRHLFHAGNFADVFKHALLAQLVAALAHKDKPFLVLDTHAGIALYDLEHPWAQKHAEHRAGISLVWDRRDAPAELAPYLEAVRAENPDGKLRWYPGSPRIARRLLRPGDRLVLSELNPADHEMLAAVFASDRQTTVRGMDGYEALRMFLPPPERRALAFVDSSFDRAQEFARLSRALAEAHARFATGVYALWYPLMAAGAMGGFERSVAGTGIRRILQVELSVHGPRWTESLRGNGMLVVNPPYKFDATARRIVEWLRPVLAPGGEGSSRVRWLVGE